MRVHNILKITILLLSLSETLAVAQKSPIYGTPSACGACSVRSDAVVGLEGTTHVKCHGLSLTGICMRYIPLSLILATVMML